MVKKAAKAVPNHLLRAARQRRSWTQQMVADQIGAPLPLNITRWERGTAFPSAFYVQKLCQLFQMSAEELGLLRIDTASQPSQRSRTEPLRRQSGHLPLINPCPLIITARGAIAGAGAISGSRRSTLQSVSMTFL